MSPAEAEKWIVDLILDSKLVAKIDSRENYVEMDTQSPSVYQQVGRCGLIYLSVSALFTRTHDDDGPPTRHPSGAHTTRNPTHSKKIHTQNNRCWTAPSASPSPPCAWPSTPTSSRGATPPTRTTTGAATAGAAGGTTTGGTGGTGATGASGDRVDSAIK